MKSEPEFLTTGVYRSAGGAEWTAGEMFRDYIMWPMVGAECVACFNADAPADTTRLVIERSFYGYQEESDERETANAAED